MPVCNLPMIRPMRPAWNRGRIVGQKRTLFPKHVWAIPVRLERAGRVRDPAFFNTAIESEVRGRNPAPERCVSSPPIACLATVHR